MTCENCLIDRRPGTVKQPPELRFAEEHTPAGRTVTVLPAWGPRRRPVAAGSGGTGRWVPRAGLSGRFTDDDLIFGGGYIGLEFGQMFRRFGSEVAIIQSAARLMGLI